MTTPRQYATGADRQAAYRARRAASAGAKTLPIPLTPGYRRWAVILEQVQGQLEGVAEEMADYRDERSEAWQNSERNERFTERLEALEELIDLLRDLPEP